MLATFFVTNTNDSGAGSLRQAMLDANIDAISDRIEFNIAGDGPHTIQPLTPLPAISRPVTIDGYTQPGASPNTLAIGNNAVLKIELNGSAIGSEGLILTANDSTIRGLVLNRFTSTAIRISGATGGGRGNRVEGNYLGTNVEGVSLMGNGSGIVLNDGARDNVVGTNGDGIDDAAERNIVVGTSGTGVGAYGAGVTGNVIAGNYVGTNKHGTALLGQFGNGAGFAQTASGNRLGSDFNGVSDDLERNVIVNAFFMGVVIYNDNTNSNVISGNFIGLGADGSTTMGNRLVGIAFGYMYEGIGAHDTVIHGNVISCNSIGISLDGEGSSRTVVTGNFIGTDATGASARPNGSGIFIGGPQNQIGGPTTADRNVISGNTGDGIRIIGTAATGNVVTGNHVGTNAAGTAALANGSVGVRLESGAQSNRIGTDGDGSDDGLEGNLISGNLAVGIYLAGATTLQNVVTGNRIGTDSTGSFAIPNQGAAGVRITGGAKSNRIGTDGNGIGDAAEGNLISGNTQRGVQIDGAGTDNNAIAGNFIGTDSTGLSPLANLQRGVLIQSGAKSNRVGTNGSSDAFNPAERNVISGNLQDGVLITGSGTDSNIVAGNLVGTNVSGNGVLPNGGVGVLIEGGAKLNRLGTDGDGVADDVEGNVISGNTGRGIRIRGSGTDSNIVAGNRIGTDLEGITAVPNGVHGITIEAQAKFNRVGTDGNGIGDEAERNLISGNSFFGIEIRNFGTDSNVVAGNYIGTNRTGTVALSNGNHGIVVSSAASGTRLGTDGSPDPFNEAERNVVAGNTFYGIELTGAHQSIVAGNYVGVDATGFAALPNGWPGVTVTFGATGNRIGTDGNGVADEAERNVISGNLQMGVWITVAGTNNNVVAGNFIGTDRNGIAALPNGFNGVAITDGAKSNRIGTDGNEIGDDVEGNLISGNSQRGVLIDGAGTDFNVVAGNRIGTDVTGTLPLGNGGDGVRVRDASGTIIGGVGLSQANVIAFNQGNGVTVVGDLALGNTIRGNSLFGNAGLSLDLGDDGVTGNDALDADTGPNNLQNAPRIDSVSVGATTSVQGTLSSTPNTTFIVDFYASPGVGPDGASPAARWLGSITVTTDAAGLAGFGVVLTAATAAGEVVTATATDPGGNTSELSLVSANQQIESLIDMIDVLVDEGTLNEGQGNSLELKLVMAEVFVIRGLEHVAINRLQAFINQVLGFVAGSILTTEQAEPLITAAQSLIEQILGNL